MVPLERERSLIESSIPSDPGQCVLQTLNEELGRFDLRVTGMGPHAARETGREIVSGNIPKWGIMLGFGGGLIEDYECGEVVLSTTFLDVNNPSCPIRTDPNNVLNRISTFLLNQEPPLKVSTGSILTSDVPVLHPDEKKQLGESHGVDLVDMESAAVAERFEAEKIPFLSIRIVLDPLNLDLSPLQALISNEEPGVAQTLRFCLQHPGSFPTFLSMIRHYLTARKTLQSLAHLLFSIQSSVSVSNDSPDC